MKSAKKTSKALAKERLEKELIRDPRSAPSIVAQKMLEQHREAQKQRNELFLNLNEVMEKSLGEIRDRLPDGVLGKSSESLEEISGKLGAAVEVLEKIGDKSDQKTVDLLKDVKSLLTKLSKKETIVKVDAPIVKVPEQKTTVVQETKLHEAMVKMLEQIYKGVMTKQGSILIENSEPSQAIPVTITDKQKKNFIDQLSDILISNSGNAAHFLGPDGKASSGRVDANNYQLVKVITQSQVRWTTSVDWNTGTIPSSMEVSGTGTEAVLQLKAAPDNDDDIPYTTPGNYALSDSGKLEIASGLATLKAQTGSDNDWPFTTSGNYTFDSADIEVSGGEARLADQFPGTFYASYDSDIDGTEGDGTLTGTGTGSPTVSGGKLDLKGDTSKYVDYDADLNADSQQQGCVRVKITPNYNTKPGTWQCFWAICKADSDLKNRIELRHSSSAGQLQLRINDQNGSSIGTFTLPNWNPTGGTEYELEFNWDMDGNASRLFIDGVQHGSTMATLGIRSADIGLLRVGSDYNANETSNFEVNDFAVFNSVQHTANFTPVGSPPWGNYSTANPAITVNTGFVFSSALNAFTETATKPGSDEIKYHVSSDNGTTWKYWNGAAWVVTDDTYAQANEASVVNTNIGSLAASGTFKFRALLHSDDGTTTPELDNIFVSEVITYSTDDDLYITTTNSSQINPSTNFNWVSATFTDSEPANTDIKVLFSNDGRASWLTWSGSAWVAPTSATDRTDATDIADAEANFSSLPLGDGTLDVRIFLKTDTNTIRPNVDNINIISDTGFSTSGTWESAAYDSTNLDQDWEDVVFNTVIPAGTTVTIKARASNNAIITDAYGPALSSGSDAGVTGQYIQFEVTMTGDGTVTPQLEDLQVAFTTPSTTTVSP